VPQSKRRNEAGDRAYNAAVFGFEKGSAAMSEHRHAEFFHAVAEGEGGKWETHHHSLGWIPATLYIADIYAQPTHWAVRRKPQTSRERFEEWVKHAKGISRADAWLAWQEAERQARENSGE
jgi:hypothetical protein